MAGQETLRTATTWRSRIKLGEFRDPGTTYTVAGPANPDSDLIHIRIGEGEHEVIVCTIAGIDSDAPRTDWTDMYLSRSRSWRAAMVTDALAIARAAARLDRECAG